MVHIINILYIVSTPVYFYCFHIYIYYIYIVIIYIYIRSANVDLDNKLHTTFGT